MLREAAGVQSNDSATAARYPRNVWRQNWTRAEEYEGWVIGFQRLKRCSCAPHFAYRATVESQMKCKRNEWCYKLWKCIRGGAGLIKISQSLIATDGIKNGAQRVEVFPE